MDKDKKLICVVAAFNEEDTIVDTVKGLKEIAYIDEIIIVNDGSRDQTLELVQDLDVTILDLEKNYGKGYAIKKAIDTYDFDYLALADGDLGGSSRELEKLIPPVLNASVDFTIAKFPSRGRMTDSKGGFGLVMGLARRGVYLFTGQEVDSSLSGQRVYSRQVIDAIDYIPARFGVEVAMTVQSLRAGFSFLEVPVLMGHRFSERDFKGILHRGKQFFDVLRTFIVLGWRR